MSLFSKPITIIWPKSKTVEVYLDKKDNNSITFDINLWDKCSSTDLQPLAFYFKQNKITEINLLIPDDVIFTKAFIYDSKITEIDKKEVIGLAESFLRFKIDPNSIEYSLTPEENRTIIKSTITDQKKMDLLETNLSEVGITISSIKPISAAISSVVSKFYNQEYFLIYPLNEHEYTLLLSKGDSVYLTTNVKGPSLDIKKIINYSTLYFSAPTTKIYLPQNNNLEFNGTNKLDKTEFNESQIAQNYNKTSNLPLPVLGVIIKPTDTNLALKPNMQPNKKNLLPVIAVFIFTAALASVIIWFILNRNTTTDVIETPASNTETTETIVPTEMPISTPTPIITEISKTIKIQVLNATDINGQAATLKEKLTKLGFKNITVGNSTETATENEIKLKPSLSTASAYFQAKMPDFPATFTDLKETSTYDAVFVIGTDLGETSSAPVTKSTITPTATKSAAKATGTVAPTKKLSPTPTVEE